MVEFCKKIFLIVLCFLNLYSKFKNIQTIILKVINMQSILVKVHKLKKNNNKL